MNLKYGQFNTMIGFQRAGQTLVEVAKLSLHKDIVEYLNEKTDETERKKFSLTGNSGGTIGTFRKMGNTDKKASVCRDIHSYPNLI